VTAAIFFFEGRGARGVHFEKRPGIFTELPKALHDFLRPVRSHGPGRKRRLFLKRFFPGRFFSMRKIPFGQNFGNIREKDLSLAIFPAMTRGDSAFTASSGPLHSSRICHGDPSFRGNFELFPSYPLQNLYRHKTGKSRAFQKNMILQ